MWRLLCQIIYRIPNLPFLFSWIDCAPQSPNSPVPDAFFKQYYVESSRHDCDNGETSAGSELRVPVWRDGRMFYFVRQSRGKQDVPEQCVRACNMSGNGIPSKLTYSCRMENLAWAACQIHCYCNSTIPTPDTQPSANDTSIAAAMKGQGQLVFKTEPTILFCNLRLAPGETKSCE